MILQASKRGEGAKLGRHLLNEIANDIVEVHEVRGFMCEDIMGAMKEAQALSYGTRCGKYLFSLSLNPPGLENVRDEDFEQAIEKIEERLNLAGQPRMMVFHEKEGRRHAHCVWSRIDADKMIAVDMPHFKLKLREVSKELYFEHGWQMPRGFIDSSMRDPRNFNLKEWQQAKRAALSAKDLKATIQECWSVSKDAQSFGRELESKGLFLARGDRRGHVAVSHEGEVFSVARMIGKNAKQVIAKLGDPDSLRSVETTLTDISQAMTPRLQGYIREAKRIAANQLRPLEEKRQEMKIRHLHERQLIDTGQAARHESEIRNRAARLPKGFSGLWHRVTGEYAKVKAQNELEAYWSLQRDREQRHALVMAQLHERQELQADITLTRERSAKQILALYKDAARYRELSQSQGPEQSPRQRQQGRSADFGLG
jgi:hypothetical protein